MFELSVALKYLVPRWRQLSVSIISLISILVIALVVWLILVFFSVTNGLEKTWISKLISLTAPVRIVPTGAYLKSFYYLSDGISSKADYTLKSLGEKRIQGLNYNAEEDEEPPKEWAAPDYDENGQVKDLVALAYNGILAAQEIPGLRAIDFVLSFGNLHLKQGGKNLSQATYLGSIDPKNQEMIHSILPITTSELNHLYSLFTLGENRHGDPVYASSALIKERLARFFAHVQVASLKTRASWVMPHHLFPKEGIVKAIPFKTGYLIPKQKEQGTHLLKFAGTELYLENPSEEPLHLPLSTPIFLEGGFTLPAELQKGELAASLHPDEVPFKVAFKLQNLPFEGIIPFHGLEFSEAKAAQVFSSKPEKIPFWGYSLKYPDGSLEFQLPHDTYSGEQILLPKSFRAQVNLGDRGMLSYYAPTTSTVQQMAIPVVIAGFYDPGIIPIGAKYVLTSKEIATLFRASHNQEETQLSNGINVRFDHLEHADKVKELILKRFEETGIAPYFKVETYREYEFTKDLIQQLHSEKNLFTLIAMVIIVVACSNIISMLIILVNDKKLEIGILRSMGASSGSIALIFGFCGVVMGLLGSLIGTLCAFFTLHNLQFLIGVISRLQGYDMFNPLFYGEVMPSEMSGEAFSFVFVATILISLIAGIVPAVKASLLRPSATLRAE
jgi:lipoprotein-releasing system permease protein